jgi:Domain of unknown function (DUF892)
MLRTADRIIAYPRKTDCGVDGIHAQRSTAASRSSPEAASRCAEGAGLDGGDRGRRTITRAVRGAEIWLRRKTMNDLLLIFMQDVYYADRQSLKALPKMAKASGSEELKNALLHHREETQGQVDRLQKAFEVLGKRARGITCEAINGLI